MRAGLFADRGDPVRHLPLEISGIPGHRCAGDESGHRYDPGGIPVHCTDPHCGGGDRRRGVRRTDSAGGAGRDPAGGSADFLLCDPMRKCGLTYF